MVKKKKKKRGKSRLDTELMRILVDLLLLLLLLILLSAEVVVQVLGQKQNPSSYFSRDDFPSDFVFGAGTSAYQVEGAVAEDGRTPTIWDVAAHEGTLPDHSTGDVACDQYHKYKEDVKLMSDLGLEAYRFSISWSRLLPNGRGAVNPKGLEYYNNLIDELIAHGVEPHVTIFHLDLPQILEDEYGGWLSPKIIGDFTEYADVCFREFGDRVTHWTTINEPNAVFLATIGDPTFPPSICSHRAGYLGCRPGNDSVDPYIAMHHSLLAHSSVANVYREKYQARQNGFIGLNIYVFWCTSMTNSREDVEATQRANDFLTGWMANPLVFGDYPEIMKEKVGSRIPSFTKHESELLKRSFDFIGINHYYTLYVGDYPDISQIEPFDFFQDMGCTYSVYQNGEPPDHTLSSDVPYNPSGMRSLLEYFKNYYGNPPVYIHENGYGTPKNVTFNDTARIDFLSEFMGSMLDAIRIGANARGYFVWAFMDLFEFLYGYQARYGLVYVDFEDNDLPRKPKLSALWFSDFLKKKSTKIRNSVKATKLRGISHS